MTMLDHKIMMRDRVYFVRQIGGIGPIKIGFSRNAWLRVPEISALSPVPMELLVAVIGERRHEKRIHEGLLDSHSHHEWFHPSAKLLKLIDDLMFGVPIDDAIKDFHYQGSLIRKIKETMRLHRTDQEQIFERYMGDRPFCPMKIPSASTPSPLAETKAVRAP